MSPPVMQAALYGVSAAAWLAYLVQLGHARRAVQRAQRAATRARYTYHASTPAPVRQGVVEAS